MIEVYLEDTPSVTTFASKNMSDKLHIIELGLNLFSKGLETYQSWNNKDWLDQLETLKVQLERERTKHKEDRQTLKDDITQQQQDRYASRLETLNIHIADLERQNQQLIQQQQSIYSTIEDKCNERFQKQLTMYETQIRDMTERLDQARIQYDSVVNRNTVSTYKGQDGESLLIGEITMLFPKAELEDTSQEPGRGDIIMRQDDFVMMIESKNYKKNVQKSEIDKFYRDLERDTNGDIQCAVFVSLNTGICCRDDFAFEVINKKPVIFIHNARQSMHSIKLAVNLFQNILICNTVDITDKNNVSQLKNIASNIKRSFTKQKKALDKYHGEQMSNIAGMETTMVELYKTLQIRY